MVLKKIFLLNKIIFFHVVIWTKILGKLFSGFYQKKNLIAYIIKFLFYDLTTQTVQLIST